MTREGDKVTVVIDGEPHTFIAGPRITVETPRQVRLRMTKGERIEVKREPGSDD